MEAEDGEWEDSVRVISDESSGEKKARVNLQGTSCESKNYYQLFCS